MYEKYFNLREKPFELVPNPAFLYMSRTHKKAMHYLSYGIKERAGFILLTGEVGSGKTTLIGDMISRLDKTVTLAKIFNTKVNSDQLIAMINDDYGLVVSGKDKVSLLRELYDFVVEQHARGCNPVLVIDEAQNLKPDHLEEIRMLSNLETDRAKLLQIVLVGQPELREILCRPELRQLRQRISINCNINPLNREETEEYIHHRLEVAGNRHAVAFSVDSIELIHEQCRGIPRLTNILCDFLLLTACNEERREVDSAMVNDIVKDLDFESHYWGKKNNTKKSVDKAVLLNALGIQEMNQP